MPSSITGLVIFVLLLAPGFVSLLISERGRVSGRELSVLRETATISLSSAAFDVIAWLLLAIAIWALPIHGPKLNDLAASDNLYLRSHWVGTTGWLLLLVGTASLCAAAWAVVLNRTDRLRIVLARRPLVWMMPSNGGTEYVSAWWKLLIDPSMHPDLDRYVTCALNDGTSIAGWLYSASHEAEETADRELILEAPLVLIDAKGVQEKLATGALTVSARSLKYLYVRYMPQRTEPA